MTAHGAKIQERREVHGGEADRVTLLLTEFANSQWRIRR